MGVIPGLGKKVKKILKNLSKQGGGNVKVGAQPLNVCR